MTADARTALDELLAYHRTHPTPRPHKGWVRAIRDALGMTAGQLGERLGITQQSVSQLEHAEVNDTITLARLRRAAAGLGCRVEYVLVPDTTLDEMATDRARRVAGRLLADVEHTMALEASEVDLRDRVDALARQLLDEDARAVWDGS